MFKIVSDTIHMTRGDWGIIEFSIPITKVIEGVEYWNYKDSEGNDYWYNTKTKKVHDSNLAVSRVDIHTLTLQLHMFKQDDIVRFKVFQANDTKTVEIQVDVTVEADTEYVDIELTKDITKIGDYINEPTDYWYEVELNPETKPQTVVGYDDVSPKIFTLYPEGADKNAQS